MKRNVSTTVVEKEGGCEIFRNKLVEHLEVRAASGSLRLSLCIRRDASMGGR